MRMLRTLPVPKEVKDLLEDLLGRSVDVRPADPLRAADIPKTLVALYVDDGLRLGAIVGLDFALTAYAGAAIGLIPAGGAAACIEDRELSKMIAENAVEVCNVLGSLLNKQGSAHLKMYQTFLPGVPPPTDAASHLLAIGRRMDLIVDIAGYGEGKLSISLAGNT
jgi:hypothetical protein